MADLFNHGSYIFGNFVQYKSASVMAGDGNLVEVTQECSQPVFRSLFEGSRSQRRFLAKFNKLAPRMPGDARADVLQLYSGVSHVARVLDAPGLGEAQVAVQHLVHGGLPAVANGVSHDAVRAVSRVVQDRSLGQSFVFQRFMMKKPRSGFVLSSSSFDWFSSKSHKKVPFFKSSST